MTNRLAQLVFVAVIGILVLTACGSDSDDVPSLRDIEGAPQVDPMSELYQPTRRCTLIKPRPSKLTPA